VCGRPNGVAGDEGDGMGRVPFDVIHKHEMGAFYFNLLSKSCLEILLQRLILLRISERVPSATTLCAGKVIPRIEKPNDIIAADLR
jgi:hypothetical protein